MKFSSPCQETSQPITPQIPLRVNPDKFQTSFDENKKTLVLDLDKTLVYLTLKPPTKGLEYSTILDEEGRLQSYAIKRPGLDGFIKEMSSLFNICIFTSMKMKHAMKAVKSIGLAPYIFEVYSRDECVRVSESIYMKSLLNLGFDLSTTIFMDDAPHHMRSQPLNGILVHPFKGEKDDNCFGLLAPFLRYIMTLSDVRPVTEKLYAFFETEAKAQEKTLKQKKEKASPKNTMPLIAEEQTEEDEGFQRDYDMTKRKKSSSANASMVKQNSWKSSDFYESKSTGASMSLSRGSSVTFFSDQESESAMSALELSKISSDKKDKQVSVL